MHPAILSDRLWLKILLGMAVGVGIAALLPITDGMKPWLFLPGDLFIALLQMVIVPLILSSVILGISGAGSLTALKSFGARLVPYFIFTTAIAITIGIAITSFVEPGLAIDRASVQTITEIETGLNLTIPDRIMNMIPTNPAEAQLTKNMLQLVVLGVIVGIALIVVQSKSVKTFHDLCEFTQDACMIVVGWAMAIAPIAVASLMIKAVSSMGLSALSSMGLYMLCVLGGLLCLLVFYMIIIFVITKQSPFQFLEKIRAAQLVAFSTSSSAATMPVSLSVAEERLGVPEKIRGFVIPLGATINMDGTALYQATAAIFLCQVFGIDLSLGQTFLLLLTTIGASIGTPAMPGVGLIVLATILGGIGVPAEGIGIILGVDRLLDMCRTVINVTGDLTATAVMNKWFPAK